MSEVTKRIALGGALTVCLFASFAAEKALWNAPAGKDFPSAGGNLGNQRYSSLAQIAPANLSRLGGAWMVHTADQSAGGNMEATPIVVNLPDDTWP